ncbi:MAG: universal stress protein [Bauldia sp.]|nr:MAG: universal stress protein [Bauldia sp.]MBZ0227340.1 universal stress protein [Bauldia sp.]
MPIKRRSTEEGHRRKFLVVADDTPECTRALHYAGRRALHTGGALILLYVIVPSEFTQWSGVENIIRAEAMEAAEASLGKAADLVREATGIEPQLVIREGSRADEIVKLIEEDEDIAILVLAAGTDKEGPGPLVTALAGKASATFPVPITIVPGFLDEASIADIA